jgi:hypothetical protein
LLALTVCVAVGLTACAAASRPRATATARPTPTSGSSGPPTTKVTPKAGDTSLCNIVSPAEFARVTGKSATQVQAGTTTDSLTRLREVYCIYSDASDPQQIVEWGTINFEVAADAQIAASTFQTVKRSFTGVTNVYGIGDAAFIGMPGGAGAGLVVVSKTLLLYLSVGGDPQAVEQATGQLATIVLSGVT